MSAHDQLFGAYIPGHSVIHRLPVGAKYLLVLAGTIPAFFTRSWIASLVLLACSVALLMLTRLPLGRALGLGGGIWILVAILMAWNIFVGRPLDGVMNIAMIVACIYLSRLLTLTTPAPVLVDALVAAARPLDRVGFNSSASGCRWRWCCARSPTWCRCRPTSAPPPGRGGSSATGSRTSPRS